MNMAFSARIARTDVSLTAIVLLSAAFLAAFAVLPTPRASAGPGDFALSGTVTDNATSLPVPGALVHLQGNTVPYLNETTTNATGEYRMELPPGNYLFAVAHGAYFLHLVQSSTSPRTRRGTWPSIPRRPAARHDNPRVRGRQRDGAPDHHRADAGVHARVHGPALPELQLPRRGRLLREGRDSRGS